MRFCVSPSPSHPAPIPPRRHACRCIRSRDGERMAQARKAGKIVGRIFSPLIYPHRYRRQTIIPVDGILTSYTISSVRGSSDSHQSGAKTGIRCVVVHDERRNAGAAPATVSGEHLFDKATEAIASGRRGQMLRPASQETCLKRNVHGRGVRKVATMCGMKSALPLPPEASLLPTSG